MHTTVVDLGMAVQSRLISAQTFLNVSMLKTIKIIIMIEKKNQDLRTQVDAIIY